jgi:CubicO group peptidase (beta-lactamase class C family)
MPTDSHSRGTLDEFVACAPALQRAGLRALVALAHRPRGAALLARAPAIDRLAQVVVALGRYDDPGVAIALGWDGDEVVARGRALRRAEGRL